MILKKRANSQPTKEKTVLPRHPFSFKRKGLKVGLPRIQRENFNE